MRASIPWTTRSWGGGLATPSSTTSPIVAGWDVAGEVLEVGPSVSEVSPGDRAYAYARLDVIQHGNDGRRGSAAGARRCEGTGNHRSVHAAAVPLTGLTAMQLLRRLDLHLDETVWSTTRPAGSASSPCNLLASLVRG